ncbi:NAD(P)H-binding protein [Streptomyces sp. So13.3]|uniref:NAD(P)H-binding protein n=1 Tax=Streptomyces TaxID=1883 RepID=UPI00110662A4|nr:MULTISPECIES: NAD(P)H-binding protein [Streptomyces]MCZ4099953.1 NAD(P)H-binding protein [Streptomyces sp. H39-C1]QNA76951.1 NAD(P)H-binding protein [Streptomyces sp. So13.3]
MKILVTGASGHVGGELVSQLAAQGRAVRALVRDPSAFEAPPGAEVAAGDLNRPESLTEALNGVDAMFLLGGFADMPGVLAGARAAGVRHVVLLSSRSVVGGNPENAVVAMHQGSEVAVRESGLGWTLLRPSGFMSNTFEWQGQLRAGDIVRAPFAGVPIAAIDPHDIAAVAAAVLGRDEHHGHSHPLSGPAAQRPVERAEILAKVLGRPLRFEGQPDDEARAEMLGNGVPERYVDAFFRFFVDGEFDDTPVLPTVEDLTGRPPRTFEDWARAHADAFR